MIVSHKHEFIYVKTRKTAGTSIEIALSSICGKDDIITPISTVDEKVRIDSGFLKAQNYFVPFNKYSELDYFEFKLKGNRLQFYNHMPCQKIIKYVDKKVWNNYFKFTVDRNPFDKLVSLYYWRGGDKTYKNVSDFLLNGGLEWFGSYDIYSIYGVVAVDKIYKYENLEYFLEDITKKLNLHKPLKLPEYKAKSQIRKVKEYRDILDDKAIEIIKIIFAREIKLLGYRY